MSEEEAASILSQIIQALRYLKTKNVCHRDIKPENILYDPSERTLKLIDFEIAKKNEDEEAILVGGVVQIISRLILKRKK